MTHSIFDHEDRLGWLHQNVRLVSKVQTIHAALQERFDFIQRIAAAVYDPNTDSLQTFLYTGEESTPLSHYTAKLADASSLHEIIEKGRPRVVNDLAIFSASKHDHTQRVAARGYRSSYTMPMYHQGRLFGFLFFNTYETDCFGEEPLGQIDPFGHLIALTIINDLTTLHTLLASVKTARDLAHARDGETGSSVADTVFIGVAVRCGGTDNGTSVDGYFVYPAPDEGSAVDVYIDGTYDSTIASGGTPFAVNDVIYIEIRGYNIVCKINGGVVFNFTDSGSHIASGRPGICAYDVGTSALDDWQGGELLAAVNVTLDTAVLTATGIPIADIVAPVSRTMKTAVATATGIPISVSAGGGITIILDTG